MCQRFGSIHEDFEEHDSDNNELALLKKLRNNSSLSYNSERRPSIKFLNEKSNAQSTYSLGSIKFEVEPENDTVSLSKFDEPNSKIDSSNFLNLLPPMTRKPSITFSETVSVFRTDRRGSSPCKCSANETFQNNA